MGMNLAMAEVITHIGQKWCHYISQNHLDLGKALCIFYKQETSEQAYVM